MVNNKDKFLATAKEYVDTLKKIEKEKISFPSSELLKELHRIVKDITKEMIDLEKELPKSEVDFLKESFRFQIEPLHSKSYFVNRATTKPRGYAGDYEIIESVYDNFHRSDNSLGKHLDHLFLNQTLAVAIRHRKSALKDYLKKKIEKSKAPIRIMNLASGSCREWFEMLPEIDNASHVTLTNIDHDKVSLEASKKRLDRINHDAKINYVEDNAFKIAEGKGVKEKYGEQDIIYSIGLYDYIKDEPLKKLLKVQYDLLKKGGKMIIAFKDKTKYDIQTYDWFTDWKFVQRDEQDIFNILSDIGIDKKNVEISREPSGVIMIFEITKY